MPRLRNKALVKHNLILWLNDLFLKDGFYTNISTGESDVYGRDISELSSVDSPSHADGRVWQSAFKQWVHESGLTPTNSMMSSPILSSGVSVNGTFYPSSPSAAGYNPIYGHSIDFDNGRVIFDTPLSSSDTVQGEFAYKEVYVDFSDAFENETKEFYIETTYKDNPMQTGVIIYPEENSRTLPMVLVDAANIDYSPYELGNNSNVLDLTGSFILWTRDSYMKDQLEDLLTYQNSVVLIGVDLNQPNGSPFPLIYNGDKNPLYTNYDTIADIYGPYFWRRIYLENISSRRIQPLYNIERTRVNFRIRVYPNF